MHVELEFLELVLFGLIDKQGKLIAKITISEGPRGDFYNRLKIRKGIFEVLPDTDGRFVRSSEHNTHYLKCNRLGDQDTSSAEDLSLAFIVGFSII